MNQINKKLKILNTLLPKDIVENIIYEYIIPYKIQFNKCLYIIKNHIRNYCFECMGIFTSFHDSLYLCKEIYCYNCYKIHKKNGCNKCKYRKHNTLRYHKSSNSFELL